MAEGYLNKQKITCAISNQYSFTISLHLNDLVQATKVLTDDLVIDRDSINIYDRIS